MHRWCRWVVKALVVGSLLALGGCTTTTALMSMAGVATDTSITWDIAKHLHNKVTEGDPVPCRKLDSVARGLTPRCGAFEPGRLVAADIARTSLQDCPLVVAARQPERWSALPELLDKGAQLSACLESPLVALAQRPGEADFSAASPEVLRAFERIALDDPRSVHHDAMRLLSSPSARQAGLAAVLDVWLAQGRLPINRLAFSPLGALHPEGLDTDLARQLEARGHTAQAAQGAYVGSLPAGFEEALRRSHWRALDWWVARMPSLVNQVPPRQSNQVAWVPLAQVMLPTFMPDPQARLRLAEYLVSRGANPWQRLPGQPHHTVLSYAQWMKSPVLEVLERPARPVGSPTTVATAPGVFVE